MNSSELENYKFQKNQVQEQLDKDPNNEELQKLHSDLQQLIDLYTLLPSITEKVKKQETKVRKQFEVGDIVLAKWSDGHFYEALVVGLKETETEVAFTGQETIEILPLDSIKETKPGQKRLTLLTSNQVVAGQSLKQVGKEKRKQKRKEENRKENLNDKERVNKWQQFKSKVKKK
jgi:survival of motor neuron-related-splicing factor 30